jgi:uncharacterized membrane protein (Fun14 family)
MSNESDNVRRRGLIRGQPIWKKTLLMVALLVAAGGGLMTAIGHYQSSQQPASDPAGEVVATDGTSQRSFLPDGARAMEVKQSKLEYYGPKLAQAGLSFAVGYVLGFGMRRFVKTFATLAAVAVVGILALQYFDVVDLNYDQVEEQTRGFFDWAQAQAGAAKDWLLTYLPSATAGTAGVASGFVRR